MTVIGTLQMSNFDNAPHVSCPWCFFSGQLFCLLRTSHSRMPASEKRNFSIHQNQSKNGPHNRSRQTIL